MGCCRVKDAGVAQSLPIVRPVVYAWLLHIGLVLGDELGNGSGMPLAAAGWMDAGGFEFFADRGEAVVLGAQLGGEDRGLPERARLIWWAGVGGLGRRGGLAWGERAVGQKSAGGEVGGAEDRERAGHVLGEEIGGLLRRHPRRHREQRHAVGFALRDAQEARVFGGIVLGWAGLDHKIDEALALLGEERRDLVVRGCVLRVGKGRFGEQHDDQAGGHGPHARTMHGGMLRLKPALRSRSGAMQAGARRRRSIGSAWMGRLTAAHGGATS